MDHLFNPLLCHLLRLSPSFPLPTPPSLAPLCPPSQPPPCLCFMKASPISLFPLKNATYQSHSFSNEESLCSTHIVCTDDGCTLISEKEASPSFLRHTHIRRTIAMKLSLQLLLILLVSTMALECSYGFYLDNSARVAQDFIGVQNEARAELGLPPLQWNTQLANYARWWAAQNAVFGDCGLHHSGGPYGENIFWGNGKDWSPYDASSDWANEKRWYSYWSNSCLFYDACGHYTQIVWRDTRYVGCARATCNDGNIFMTCNYYPPGNYIGQRPY